MSRRLLHLALWAATALIAACGGDGGEPESPPAERAPGQAVMGIAGGRVAGIDGASIEVPAGALPADITLSIARDSSDAPPLPAPFVPASAVFQALPHGQTFDKPVAVTLPYDPAAIGPGQRPAVMKVTPGRRGQLILDGTVADGRITVQVKSFSYFTVIGVPVGEIVSPNPPSVPGPDPEQSYLTLRLQNSWPSLPVTGSGQRLVQQPSPTEEAQVFVSAYVGSESAIRSMCAGDLSVSVVRAPAAVYRLPSDGGAGGINRIAVDEQSGRASRLAAYPQSNAEWLIYGDLSTGVALDRGYASTERLNVAEMQWNPPEEPEGYFFFSTPQPTINLPEDAIVDNWGAEIKAIMTCAIGWSAWDLVLPLQPVVAVRGFPLDDIVITSNPPAVATMLEGQLLHWTISANAPTGTPTAGVWQAKPRGSSTWADVPPLPATVPPGLWMWNNALDGAVRRQDDGTMLRVKVCTTAASPARCVYSAEGQLRVSTAFPPPAVVSQPPSRTFNVGDRLDLPFTFRGLPLPTRVTWQTRTSDTAPWVDVDAAAYQSWFDGRVDPATFLDLGAEQATDHLKGLQPLTLADRGRQFRASYTTVAGSVTSAVATIGVTTGNTPPQFTTQPADASVAQGSAVLFSTAVTGAAPISYQWTFNGTRIPGANGPMLTLSGVNTGNAGTYQLEASNVEATVRSNPVRLTVTGGTTGGLAPTISGQPASITVPAGAAAGFAVAAGPGPLTYQWTKDGVPIAGATQASYAIASVTEADRGAYAVTVANSGGVTSSAVAQLVVGAAGGGAAAPTIATQPVGLSVVAGQPALLAVGASGSGPLAYRWHRDGNDVPGATGPVLRIDAATAGDAGTYTVTVSNTLGSATSTAAGLVVTAAPGAPRVDQGPGAVTGVEGGSVTFTATVSGSPAPQCLWLRNGIVIPGATSCSSYTMGPLTRADDGVIVNVFAYNAGGHVFARGAALTVVTGVAPSITRQPVSPTWSADSVSFSLDVAGTPLPRVTWAVSSERLSDSGRHVEGACSFDYTGAWSPVLVLTQVSAGCIGLPFVALVDNDAGRATSDTVTMIAPAVVATAIAGQAGTTGSVDGAGSTARFNTPNYLAVAADGSIAIGDFGNSTIRIVTPPDVVKTFAGTPGVFGFADGTGTSARFAGNGGLAFDRAGNLFVSDWDNHVIRRITPEGVVTTFAGTAGAPGSADGSGAAARFRNPNGLTIDATGNLFVVDWGNHTLRRITPAGEVSTFAGTAGVPGTADGSGAAARFNTPGAIAIDGAGQLYVTDMFNHTVRKITPAGGVSTLAGQPGVAGTADGNGSAARFDTPAWITATADGTLFVVSAAGDTVRRVSPTGAVETVVGVAGDNSVLRLGSDPRLRNARGVWAVSTKELLLNADQSLIRIQLP